MINIMSGTTAVTLSPSNNATKNGKSTKTSAGDKNSAMVSNKTAGAAVSMQVQNTQNNQQTSASSTQAQVQQANTQSVDYSKEAIAALQQTIRKEHLDRNYYIDKSTNVPVLQIVNNKTNQVIGQYPADLYLSLIMKVRENQKAMVNQQSMAAQQATTNEKNVVNQQSIVEQQLMANQKS